MTAELVSMAEGVVPRTFAVLEVLAQSPEPLRLSAVALRLGLQKSTAHRILAALIGLGFAQQSAETGCYSATLKLWELGANVITEHPIKRAASGFLQELQRATGETVSLVIRAGDDVLYLDKMISPRPIRFTTRIGSRVPAPLTAGGKAILAHAGDAGAVLERTAAALGDRRRLDIAALTAELEQVRERGYAMAGYQPGVVGFAAPIMTRGPEAAAAISVSAPAERVDEAGRREIIEHLLSTCASMAERVGRL
ncbi:IclR family transcriptional regulator [Phenylobacterium sp.]|uniref:IclR family transcriptional regulator n=1 Tax=Phenylobacterium sp. TaxID=1871053 RepID=UPI003BAD7E79